MKKETTIEDLAGMVAKGFDEAKTNLDQFRGEVGKRFDVLEDSQEQIKLKLDNVAYRFELVELQRRVDILEKKAGIK